MKCKYKITQGDNSIEFDSEAELDDFIIDNMDLINADGKYSDIVFSMSKAAGNTVIRVNEIKEEAEKISDAFEEAYQKAKNDPTGLIPMPSPPYIGVTKYINDRRNSAGERIAPEFLESEYWSRTLDKWQSRLEPGQTLDKKFTESEISVLSEGSTLQEKYDSFLKKRSTGGTYKPLTKEEAENLKKAIEKKWYTINTEGTAIHFVMQQYFSTLLDSSGNAITDSTGRALHGFDLTNTPHDGLPSIQDYMMDKIHTELKAQMKRKYSDDLITPDLLEDLLDYAEKLHRHIKKMIPGNLQFFTELKMTADIADTQRPQKKLMGIIDLLVVDDKGVPHMFDYKCSDKLYEKYHETKKLGFLYQQAIYARMLQQHGINIDDMSLHIAPITLDNLTCINKDEILVNGDKAQYKFDKIYSPDEPEMTKSIRSEIENKTNLLNNVDEFLPEPEGVDSTSEDSISFVTTMMGKFFPSYNNEKTEDEVREQMEKEGCFEKKSDGMYHYKMSASKEITDADPSKLLKKAIKLLKNQKTAHSKLARTIREAIQYANKHKTTDISSIIQYIDTKYIDDATAFQGWFKNYLQKYLNGDWDVLENKSAQTFGIVLLRNKVTKQIDVLKLSASNLKFSERKVANRENLTRAFETDNIENTRGNSKMLKDVQGNRELIETALFLNTMPSLCKGSYSKSVIGNIEVMNPYRGQGLSASNEEILYSLDKLKKYAPLPDGFDDNIKLGRIKFAPKWQLFRNELYYSLNNHSGFKLQGKDYYNGCLNDLETITADPNNQAKINVILRVVKELEKDYNIQQIQQGQLLSETNISQAYRLYYSALLALGDLRGLNFRQQLKESANWIEGGLRNIFAKGLNGVNIDNPGNLVSSTLNSITKLHTQALQNIRRDLMYPVSELRNLVQKLKEEKNFGYSTSLVKNDIDLYKNMMHMTEDGDLVFTYTDQLHGTEQEFLKFALKRINMDRFPTKSEKELDEMEKSHSIDYYRVPLARASYLDQKDAYIKMKADKDGTLKEYHTSLWGSIKNMLKSLSPKNALKELREKVEGVFVEDDGKFKSANDLFRISSMFDANEPTVGSNTVQDRLDNIAVHGTGYFEQNLEKLLMQHMYSYTAKERINAIMPEVKSGLAFLINMGNTQNIHFGNDVKYYENYIVNKMKNMPLGDDPILENTSQGARATVGKVRSIASFIALAFSPVQGVGQFLQGVWHDIQLVVQKPDGSKAFTLQNMKDAFSEVYKDMFHFSTEPTKCQLINELYGINDMDMNQYADKLAEHDEHYIGGKLMHFAYKFVSRPDFYNRMTIIIAQMKQQGVWDALEVKDGRLVYNYKKDMRFSAYANGKTSDPDYGKQQGLYMAIASLFVAEGILNEDGTPFQIGQDLPSAYTNKEMEGMKSLTDTIYGYYTNEKKSMIHSTFLGGLFMQMKTFWSGKKNQYLNSGGVRLRGHWEQAVDNDGNELYYQTDEQGHIKTDEAPVAEKDLRNPNMKIPFTQWKGQWEEGIVQTFANMYQNVLKNEDGDFTNPLAWGQRFKEYSKTMDPSLQAVKIANIKQLQFDLFTVIVLGCIIGSLLGDWDDELKKEAKDNPSSSAALKATGANLLTKSWLFAVDDFNFITSIASPVVDWNPFAVESSARVVQKIVNGAFGDESMFQTITHMLAPTKVAQPFMDYLAPEGGYIIDKEE